jgi:hypothetical protein
LEKRDTDRQPVPGDMAIGDPSGESPSDTRTRGAAAETRQLVGEYEPICTQSPALGKGALQPRSLCADLEARRLVKNVAFWVRCC